MTQRIEVRSLVGNPFVLGVSSQPHSPAMLTIACKASYMLEPKRCAFAPQPVAISVRPQRAQGAAMAADGLYDLPLSQQEAEVIVLGAAPMTGNLSFEGGAAVPVSVVAGQPCRVTIEQLPIDKGFSLSGVHGRRQPLMTRLPSARPRVRVESTSATAHIVPLTARRLLIDLEHMRCTVCWYGEVGPQRQGVLLGLALGLAKGLTTQWPDHTAPTQLLDPTAPPHSSISVRPPAASSPRIAQPVSARPPAASSPSLAQPVSVRPPAASSPRIAQPVSARPPAASSPSLAQPVPARPPVASSPSLAQPVSTPPPKSAPPRRTAPAAVRRPVGRVIAAPSTAFAPPSAPAGPSLSVPNPALAMIKRPSPSTAPSPEPTPKTARAKKSAPSKEPLVLEILWRADDCVRRLSSHDRLRRSLPRRPAAPKKGGPILGRSAKQPAPAEPDDAAVLRHVMRHAPLTPMSELRPLLAASLRGDVPPEHRLVLVAGTLTVLFDHKAELEIMTESARPLADEKKGGALAEAIAHADRIVKTPLAEDEGIVKRLKKQLLVAWRSSPRELPAEFLQEHTSRLLLSQRRHRQQQLWGEAQVCAALPADDGELPVYLPPAAAEHLPLVRAWKARLLAEVVPRQDERPISPIALRVSAMARIVDMGSNQP